jgi:hypothetical protein
METKMGRFLSPKDLSAARHDQEVWNSLVKRGEIDESQFARYHYQVCGCGVEGCGFTCGWKKDAPALQNSLQTQ